MYNGFIPNKIYQHNLASFNVGCIFVLEHTVDIFLSPGHNSVTSPIRFCPWGHDFMDLLYEIKKIQYAWSTLLQQLADPHDSLRILLGPFLNLLKQLLLLTAIIPSDRKYSNYSYLRHLNILSCMKVNKIEVPYIRFFLHQVFSTNQNLK